VRLRALIQHTGFLSRTYAPMFLLQSKKNNRDATVFLLLLAGNSVQQTRL